MYSRKRHDRTSRNAKEADIQLSGLSLLISQDSSSSPSHKTKQSPSKSASKSQPSKTSPRRRPQTRTEDLKSNHTSSQRHQSPSPSRASSRTSSSPVPVSNSCFRTKSEDGATASVSSSPVSGGPSSNRSSWTPTRKLSARSRTSDSQSGKSKVTVRHIDNGKILVKRSSEEKCNDPDRLLMDRCNLTMFPVIEGEERLRLLNLKHNEIKKIENLFSFSFLMFLDLSDNCIDSISSLDCLPSLRILMLARNRIKQIQGLEELPHLDVLDLSGNEIKEIENISHLRELRVLNLAGNQLNHLSCLKGLDSLVELNVSKNLLTVLEEVDHLPRLQRLFVAQNNIERLEDMMCIVNITSLAELTLEGCPVTQRNHYRYFILFRLPHLKFLDMRRVLDEEKRTAQIIMRKEEMKRQEGIRIAKLKEAREKAIVNARNLWESGDKDQRASAGQPEPASDTPFLHASALPLQLLAARTFSTFSEEEEDCSLCERSYLPCEYCSGSKPRPTSGKSTKSQKTKKKQSKRSHESLRAKKSKSPSLTEHELTDSRLTYLAEIEEDILHLYGPGAVAAAVSASWHHQILGSIRTVSFHFIVYDSISHLLHKVKDQFPNVAAVTFECTNIQTFAQLNALGDIVGLQSLMIGTEGNPVLELPLWRSYAIYRLSPSISFINGTMVAEYERMKAEEMFGGLGTAVSSLLPKFRLSSLLNSSRVMQLYLSDKGYSPNSLQRQPDSQIASEVIKAALIYNPDFESKLPAYSVMGKKMLEKAAMCVEEKVRKRVVFQRQWPSMFLGIVNDALEDYADLSRHMKLSMQSLLKRCKTLNENNQKE